MNDVSGNNRLGTLLGTTVLSASGGGHAGVGKSIVFDGVAASGFDVPAAEFDSPAYDPGTNSFSVAFWVKNVNNTGGLTDHASTNGYQMGPSAGNALNFLVGSGGAGGTGWESATTGAGTLPSDGEFHHVALVVDTSGTTTVNIYIDGVDEAYSEAFGGTWPASMGSVTFANPLMLGNINTATTFVGSIDDYAIFDQALTEEEVEGLFDGVLTPDNLEFPVAPAPEPGTALLACFGLAGLCLSRRRRRNR